MASNDIAIKVDNLVKTFKIPVEAHSGVKQKIINRIKGRSGYRDFTPLKGVSFEIKKGEFFGIVGRNGSGKSTLLKTIAGIYHPDGGGVVVNGVLVPFIELGVGFNAELTGRENIFLNGALLGFSRSEMEAMYDEIVDFAELHEFMEEKIKNYSSGMQVRLAFSIAIRAKGDILLLDEVLAVGDSAFQQKCFSYFNNLKNNGQTVVLVTHSMSAVERFCDRALLLDQGQVKKIGNKSEVADMYEELFVNNGIQSGNQPSKLKKDAPLVDVKLESAHSDNAKVKFKERFGLAVTIQAKYDIEACNIGINIRNEHKSIVFSMDSRSRVDEFNLKAGEKKTLRLQLDNLFTNGEYSIGVHVVDERRKENQILFMDKDIFRFNVYGVLTHTHSLFHTPYTASLKSDS